MRRHAVALVLALLAGTGHLRAQQLEPILDESASGKTFARELEQVLNEFGEAWSRADASALAQQASSAGVSINIGGDPIGPLGTRQAAAALRQLFEQRETVALRSGTAQIVGGAPARAFGELTWFVRARGTTIPEHSTVFVALVRESDRWRVTQIRLIR